MRRYSKPATILPTAPDSNLTDEGSFDVAKELELCEEILRREVRNLMSESARGKLGDKSAASLRDYIKLLSDMREEQQEKLKAMSTEELKKLVK